MGSLPRAPADSKIVTTQMKQKREDILLSELNEFVSSIPKHRMLLKGEVTQHSGKHDRSHFQHLICCLCNIFNQKFYFFCKSLHFISTVILHSVFALKLSLYILVFIVSCGILKGF